MRIWTVLVLILGLVFFSDSRIHAQDFSPLIDFPVEHFTFKGAPVVDQRGDTVRFDLNVYYHIPANPRGVIYFFHGHGSAAAAWFKKVEQPLLLRDAVERGFGIVTMESNNRVNNYSGRRWAGGEDSTAAWKDNVDTGHFWRVHADSMLAKGRYGQDVPVFAVGFSNGAAFTSRLALRASTFYLSSQDSIPDLSRVVPLQAVAIYGALGLYIRDPHYDIPGIFNVGINDNRTPAYPNMTEHPDWPYAPDRCVEYQYNLLVAAGIDAAFNVKPEEALRPDRFTRIPGIDSLASVAIYNILKAARDSTGQMLLDSTDHFLVNPTRFNVRPLLPVQRRSFAPEIDQQNVAVYAEHIVLSDFRNNTLDFFERHLTATSIAESAGNPHPQNFALLQNYPNPFTPLDNLAGSSRGSRFGLSSGVTPETVIRFQLPVASDVELAVFDMTGRHVRTLVRGMQNAGVHEMSWDGRDARGQVVASGIYMYRLVAGGEVQVRRMVVVR